MASGQTPGAGALPARCKTNDKTPGANTSTTSDPRYLQGAQLSFNNNNAPSSDLQPNLGSPDSPIQKSTKGSQRERTLPHDELGHSSGVNNHQQGSYLSNCDNDRKIGMKYYDERGSNFGYSQLGTGSNRKSDIQAQNSRERVKIGDLNDGLDDTKMCAGVDSNAAFKDYSDSVPQDDYNNDVPQARDFSDSIPFRRASNDFQQPSDNIHDYSDEVPEVRNFTDDVLQVRDFSDNVPQVEDYSDNVPQVRDFSELPQVRDFSDNVPHVRDFSDNVPDVRDFSDNVPQVRDFSDDGPCMVEHVQAVDIFSQFNSKQPFQPSRNHDQTLLKSNLEDQKLFDTKIFASTTLYQRSSAKEVDENVRHVEQSETSHRGGGNNLHSSFIKGQEFEPSENVACVMESAVGECKKDDLEAAGKSDVDSDVGRNTGQSDQPQVPIVPHHYISQQSEKQQYQPSEITVRASEQFDDDLLEDESDDDIDYLSVPQDATEGTSEEQMQPQLSGSNVRDTDLSVEYSDDDLDIDYLSIPPIDAAPKEPAPEKEAKESIRRMIETIWWLDKLNSDSETKEVDKKFSEETEARLNAIPWQRSAEEAQNNSRSLEQLRTERTAHNASKRLEIDFAEAEIAGSKILQHFYQPHQRSEEVSMDSANRHGVPDGVDVDRRSKDPKIIGGTDDTDSPGPAKAAVVRDFSDGMSCISPDIQKESSKSSHPVKDYADGKHNEGEGRRDPGATPKSKSQTHSQSRDVQKKPFSRQDSNTSDKGKERRREFRSSKTSTDASSKGSRDNGLFNVSTEDRDSVFESSGGTQSLLESSGGSASLLELRRSSNETRSWDPSRMRLSSKSSGIGQSIKSDFLEPLNYTSKNVNTLGSSMMAGETASNAGAQGSEVSSSSSTTSSSHLNETAIQICVPTVINGKTVEIQPPPGYEIGTDDIEEDFLRGASSEMSSEETPIAGGGDLRGGLNIQERSEQSDKALYNNVQLEQRGQRTERSHIGISQSLDRREQRNKLEHRTSKSLDIINQGGQRTADSASKSLGQLELRTERKNASKRLEDIRTEQSHSEIDFSSEAAVAGSTADSASQSLGQLELRTERKNASKRLEDIRTEQSHSEIDFSSEAAVAGSTVLQRFHQPHQRSEEVFSPPEQDQDTSGYGSTPRYHVVDKKQAAMAAFLLEDQDQIHRETIGKMSQCVRDSGLDQRSCSTEEMEQLVHNTLLNNPDLINQGILPPRRNPYSEPDPELLISQENSVERDEEINRLMINNNRQQPDKEIHNRGHQPLEQINKGQEPEHSVQSKISSLQSDPLLGMSLHISESSTSSRSGSRSHAPKKPLMESANYDDIQDETASTSTGPFENMVLSTKPYDPLMESAHQEEVQAGTASTSTGPFRDHGLIDETRRTTSEPVIETSDIDSSSHHGEEIQDMPPPGTIQLELSGSTNQMQEQMRAVSEAVRAVHREGGSSNKVATRVSSNTKEDFNSHQEKDSAVHREGGSSNKVATRVSSNTKVDFNPHQEKDYESFFETCADCVCAGAAKLNNMGESTAIDWQHDGVADLRFQEQNQQEQENLLITSSRCHDYSCMDTKCKMQVPIDGGIQFMPSMAKQILKKLEKCLNARGEEGRRCAECCNVLHCLFNHSVRCVETRCEVPFCVWFKERQTNVCDSQQGCDDRLLDKVFKWYRQESQQVREFTTDSPERMRLQAFTKTAIDMRRCQESGSSDGRRLPRRRHFSIWMNGNSSTITPDMWRTRQIEHGWFMDDFGKFNVEYCKFQIRDKKRREQGQANQEVGEDDEAELRINRLGFIIKKAPYNEDIKEILSLISLNTDHFVEHFWCQQQQNRTSNVSQKMYVCTRYHQGGSLQYFLQEVDVKSNMALLLRRLFKQALDATEFLHNKGILYLNWHANNLVLNETATQVFLSNFTSAVIYHESGPVGNIHPEKVCFVNPRIAPPELINGDELSKKSDVWGLGCLLYQMLWGRMPYHEYSHGDPENLRNQIRDPRSVCRPLIPVSEAGRHVVDFLAKCWMEDPGERDTLEHLQAHELFTDVDAPLLI